MNNNFLCVFDFETGGKNPHRCQITQIAAIILHPRSLKPVDTFNQECRLEMDETKLTALELDPVEQEALKITGKTVEGLSDKPSEAMMWKQFSLFVKKYNPSTGTYKAPLPCGYNILNFDLAICDRATKMYKTPELFNRHLIIDCYHEFRAWTENNPSIQSHKLSDFMDFMGLPPELKENAHDALQDVKNVGNCLIKLLHFKREISKKTDFSQAFANNRMFIE